eukprot:2926746-Amphidinium_carterae.2
MCKVKRTDSSTSLTLCAESTLATWMKQQCVQKASLGREDMPETKYVEGTRQRLSVGSCTGCLFRLVQLVNEQF